MIKHQITIINKLGLHARAAAKLAKTSSQFSSSIKIGSQHSLVDGKSVMSLMLLAASKGTALEIICDGQDEDRALEAITHLIDDRFGEGE
ncbi:MAG: HPr family phosphocarrier protein [Cellvibrionaceae bacterium]